MKFKKKYLLFILLIKLSVYAQKNRIKIGDKFVYVCTISDLKTGKIMQDTIFLERKFGLSNGTQKKIYWSYNPNNNIDTSIILKIHNYFLEDSLCSKGSCKNILQKNKYWIKEKTGLVENKKIFWIHPPRSKWYRLLEFTPFPCEMKMKNSYKDSLTLGTGWGKHIGTKVVSDYQKFKLSKGIKIKAISNCKLGNSDAEFLFDDKGIVNMNYNVFNELQYSIKRIKI